MKPSPRGVNLHRPLRPGELKRRFRRIRATIPPVGEADGGSAEPSESDTDDCWDPWYSDHVQFGHWKIGATWDELLGGYGVTIADRAPHVDWTSVPVVGPGETPPRVPAPRCRWSGEELPSVLLGCLSGLPRTHEVPLTSLSDVAKMDLSPFRQIAEKYWTIPFRERPPGRGGIVAALYLSQFWVRAPADFVPKSDDMRRTIPDLMEHLFTVHPVPPCLRNAWFARHDDEFPDLRWIAWFILAGRGVSIHRAAPMFGWRASRPLLQHLPAAPGNLSPTDAFIWAEIKGLGGSETELRRLQAHADYAYSPVYVERNPRELPDPQPHEFGDFWDDTVRWLASHRRALTDEMCGLILPWAAHLYRIQMHTGEHFSWKGRSPKAAHRLAAEYDREIQMPYPDMCWETKGWNWKSRTEQDGTWSVRELLSARELYEEGQAMSHCVASYAMRCFQGHSAIFSLRHGGKRRLTFEIHPDSLCLVQARGSGNRAPTPQESAMLQEWQARKLAG